MGEAKRRIQRRKKSRKRITDLILFNIEFSFHKFELS